MGGKRLCVTVTTALGCSLLKAAIAAGMRIMQVTGDNAIDTSPE
jgi:hypothetical protein